jgi:hypothetical protein
MMGKQGKTPITVDEKEYIYEEMTEKQKTLVNHISDLDRKIANMRFNLDQLTIGRQAFVNLLSEEVVK